MKIQSIVWNSLAMKGNLSTLYEIFMIIHEIQKTLYEIFLTANFEYNQEQSYRTILEFIYKKLILMSQKLNVV